MKRYTYYKAFRLGCVYACRWSIYPYNLAFFCQPAPQCRRTPVGIFTDVPDGEYNHSLITAEPQPQIRYFQEAS